MKSRSQQYESWRHHCAQKRTQQVNRGSSIMNYLKDLKRRSSDPTAQLPVNKEKFEKRVRYCFERNSINKKQKKELLNA